MAQPVKAAEPLHKIPFELFGEKIFLKGVILDTIEITVLFDAGIRAYIHSGTSQKYGIEYTGSSEMMGLTGSTTLYTIEKFGIQFGDLFDTLENVKSQVTAPYLNRRVDMVFGASWIRRYVVEVDYGENLIKLYSPYDFQISSEYQELPVLRWGSYPIVHSTFTFSDGSETQLRVELNIGSEVGFTLDQQTTREYKLTKNEKNRGRIMLVGPDGKGVFGMICRIPNVTLGTFNHPQAKGGVFHDGYGINKNSGVQGQIGQPILKFYNVVFDFNNSKLWIAEKPELDDDE